MASPLRARDGGFERRFSFGGRVPWAVGLVLALTIGLSLLVAVGSRHAGSLFDVVALSPADVWRGQIWRLATWTFVEGGPIALLFGALFLYWFGTDLANELGSRRFLALFGGVALFAAVGTCLAALVDSAVAAQQYLGGWALSSAMIVAWGLWFPHRVVRIWFVIPIRGAVLAWLTVAITVAFAAYAGWEGYVPELLCEAGILAWLFRGFLAARARRVTGRAASWRRGARAKERARKKAASVAYLRVLEADDDEPPPLPSDLDGRVRDLMSPGDRDGS